MPAAGRAAVIERGSVHKVADLLYVLTGVGGFVVCVLVIRAVGVRFEGERAPR